MQRGTHEVRRALDAAGLKPSSQGARVRFSASGTSRTVIDGPFTETKELIAGYWILQVSSKEEAIEWGRRAPSSDPGQECEIEIRPFFELDDFPPGEAIEQERELGARLELKKNQ